MIGGLLEEIEDLDTSQKTIILVADYPTRNDDPQYYKIIKKQEDIILKTLKKFGLDKIYLYFETPEKYRTNILDKDYASYEDTYNSFVIIKRFYGTVPLKFSSVTRGYNRRDNNINYTYAYEIDSIFNKKKDCVIGILNLFRIPEIVKIFHENRPDIKIVVVNTVSDEQLTPLMPDIVRNYSDVLNLIQIENPYELP
jgi:hypothetical protein